MFRTKIFSGTTSDSRGSMLVEFLLTTALAVLVIPFIFQYQNSAVRRAENMAVAREMENIQTALERYIIAHRDELLAPVGKNITRVDLNALVEFGVPDTVLERRGTNYQVRILKSNDYNAQATLQGVIILTDGTISPLRTREIVNMGGGQMGFVDGGRAYGAFGAWQTGSTDLGLGDAGIIETTAVTRDNAKYLWRVPSDNSADATMLSALNLGGHDVADASFVNARALQFDETMTATAITTSNAIFQNRVSLPTEITATSATVSGVLASDGKSINVTGNLSLADVGKFSSLNVEDLYVTNITLPTVSISDTSEPTMLKINQSLDMTSGRISAMYVTVGFAGSITPRLDIKGRIEDSRNEYFYWDGQEKTARLLDVMFTDLRDMAPNVLGRSDNTTSRQIFSAVAANRNATAGNYMNAINQIQEKVRAKYRRLNLQ